MSCNVYERYELGEIDDEAFRQHARNCRDCRHWQEKDAELLALARELNEPIRAPLLWDRIANTLHNERQKSLRPKVLWLKRSPSTMLRAAAAALIIIVAGFASFRLLQPEKPTSGLLSDSALARVERIELAYIQSIEELEQQAQFQMDAIDIELALLYRDRLETIDEQIERCKQAVARNPANAHIRRYLLAALQDKKETLAEILSYERGSGLP